MEILEVRDALNPEILFGWLPFIGSIFKGTTVKFSTVQKWFKEDGTPCASATPIALTVDEFCDKDDCYLALKAENISIETLRKIPNFVENNEKAVDS